MTQTTTIRNGIDVEQLTATIEHVREDEEVGTFTFRATSRWQDGMHSTGTIDGFDHAGQADDSRNEPFVLDGDEPPVLLGSNRGPNAVELVLQALGFCYAAGYIANAAAQGIEIERMDYEIEGDLDVRSFLGEKGPRPGFTQIRATGIVSSPNATAEQLTALCEYVQATSPVRDVLADPTPVHTSLQIV